MLLLRALFLLPIMLAISIGYAQPQIKQTAKSPIILTDKDTGHRIDMQVGQELVVRLPSNRTTGYSWTVHPTKGEVLKAQGASVYIQTPGSSGPLIGAGGAEAWHFKAIKPGQQALQFNYRRPWEKNIAPARSVAYSVKVR